MKKAGESTPKLMDALAAAARQERERLQRVENRPRHFVFGLDESVGGTDETGCLAVFRYVPEQVMRAAQYDEDGSVFRAGGQYLNGSAEPGPAGLEVFFPAEELEGRGVTPGQLFAAAADGLEYVMDTRDLAERLAGFLTEHQDAPNILVPDLAGKVEPRKWESGIDPGRLADLNDSSQNPAVRRALSQRVTFIWGPPGTGKTRTLAALAAALVRGGKRVLLAAMSNAAVDNLLDAVARQLGDGLGGVGVARLGRTMDEKVRRFGRARYNYDEFGGRKCGYDWFIHVRKADLVAATFTKLASPGPEDPRMLDAVLADEVSMANVPNLAVAACHAREALVLGGDPSQLPPVYPEDAAEPNEWFRDSVFDRAGIGDIDDPRVAFLDTQYRMQEEIGGLVSDSFYGGRLRSAAAPVPELPGFPARVLFCDSGGAVEEAGGRAWVCSERRFNRVHAEAAARAVRRALEADVAGEDIGVIVPYNAQVVCVRHAIDSACRDFPRAAARVRVSTIHSFQGAERRVIVVDFTDSNVEPGPLTADPRLVNVALSRARECLVMTGNGQYLTGDPRLGDRRAMFRRIIDRAEPFSP